MEIERKWLVDDWPEAVPALSLISEHSMRQGYINVHPTVRIREEALSGGQTSYILCCKSSGILARKEIEIAVTEQEFAQLEDLIGLPLIKKLRRTYLLPDGCHLEVNHVDEGMPTEFWYAEIEYPTVEDALSWDPAAAGLAEYLRSEVTEDPSQSMGSYWAATRLQQ